MSSKQHTVIFTPSGKRGSFAEGTNLLAASRSLGVDVDSVCGGRGICGRCQVSVGEGDFPKFAVVSKAASLGELTEPEKRFDARKGLKADRRLSCHCAIQGDLVIDVPAESQVHKQVVRKAASTKKLELDPVVRLFYVDVVEADMHNPKGDLTRLQDALREQWGFEHLTVDFSLLSSLQATLREGNWKVTAVIYDAQEIIALYPGLRTDVYGMAVDIGSTTIAAHLTNLTDGNVLASAGLMNPQIRFGEDLMSRVSYVMMNPNGDKEMTKVVREALNSLAKTVAKDAGIKASDILEISFVANPVMHHLLLGINPIELGGAPFALATDQAMTLNAKDLDLKLHAGAKAYLLPCIAGHVGADTAGVVLSEAPNLAEEMTLLVDIGTNAEIVLGNKHKLAACSSPTGPALEGAQISSGQRAAPGALERVRIDPLSLEPRFKVIGCDLWSDDPAFEAATASLPISGICGSGIIEVLGEMFLADIIRPDGSINGSIEHPRILKKDATYEYLVFEGNQAKGDVRISVTQQDVRAIQLAKGALFAGIQLLMEKLKVEQIDRIALAGAFGSHIDTKYALILGFIPDCDLDKVTSIGNAAGDGALQALLSKKARLSIEETVRSIEKIETAIEPRFQEHFVDALAIPNKSFAFPKLEAALGLPNLLEKARAFTSSNEGEGGRRKRRRRTVA